MSLCFCFCLFLSLDLLLALCLAHGINHSTAEHDKKQKYSQAYQDRRATFTPLFMSVDGMLGCEATAFLKWISDMLWLSGKWTMEL